MSTRKTDNPRTEPRHSIAVVSRRTGVAQLLLRAWERRYDAVTPARTPTGRRMYSDRDLEKLTILGLLTGVGHRIGDIATLPMDDLRQLAEENSASPAPPVRPTGEAVPASHFLEDALKAIAAMDARGLEAVLNQSLLHLSKPILRKDFLGPLLEEVGVRWCDGRLRIAHEHMASAVIISFLSGVNSRYQVTPGSPLVTVATPSGTHHEMGALLAASHAFEAGWDVLYLGPNMPAEDLAATSASRNVRAILLSIVFPAGDDGIAAQLRELRKFVGPGMPIVVGGMAAVTYKDVLSEIGAHLIGPNDNLTEFFSNL